MRITYKHNNTLIEGEGKSPRECYSIFRCVAWDEVALPEAARKVGVFTRLYWWLFGEPEGEEE